MHRIEINCSTGEPVQIAQIPYKDASGVLHVLDADQTPEAGLVQVTEEEAAALSPQEIAKKKVEDAKVSLQVTDMTATRCFKAGIPFPQDWRAYTEALRAIVDGSQVALPVQPPFPGETLNYEP